MINQLIYLKVKLIRQGVFSSKVKRKVLSVILQDNLLSNWFFKLHELVNQKSSQKILVATLSFMSLNNHQLTK